MLVLISGQFVLVLNEKKSKIRELKQASMFLAALLLLTRIVDNIPANPPLSPASSGSDADNYEEPHGEKTDDEHNETQQHTPSLTWNIHTKTTPSLDLLESEEAVISTTIRKR